MLRWALPLGVTFGPDVSWERSSLWEQCNLSDKVQWTMMNLKVFPEKLFELRVTFTLVYFFPKRRQVRKLLKAQRAFHGRL